MYEYFGGKVDLPITLRSYRPSGFCYDDSANMSASCIVSAEKYTVRVCWRKSDRVRCLLLDFCMVSVDVGRVREEEHSLMHVQPD